MDQYRKQNYVYRPAPKRPRARAAPRRSGNGITRSSATASIRSGCTG